MLPVLPRSEKQNSKQIIPLLKDDEQCSVKITAIQNCFGDMFVAKNESANQCIFKLRKGGQMTHLLLSS